MRYEVLAHIQSFLKHLKVNLLSTFAGKKRIILWSTFGEQSQNFRVIGNAFVAASARTDGGKKRDGNKHAYCLVRGPLNTTT